MIASLGAVLIVASCAPSTPLTRIQQQPQKFAALDTQQKTLVERGQIDRGMSADAVYIAWGHPARVFQGSSEGRLTERWDYTGTRAVHYGNFYGPCGRYGPYGRYPRYDLGPGIAYIPYRVASVWFVDGKVDAWERIR